MICSCCYTEKVSEDFPKTPSGYRSYCKECYSYIKWWNRQKPESKEVHNETARKWAASNRDKSRQIKKESRDRNPNQGREARKIWREENAGLVNSYTAQRRAKKRLATPVWADREEIAYIYELAKERGLVVDHIVPLVHPMVCGLHAPDNLRCISAECNARKGNFYFPDTLPSHHNKR